MMRKLKILITGAGGIIGVALCRRLIPEANVIALDVNRKPEDLTHSIIWEQKDIAKFNAVEDICNRYMPDVIIHCAGIAHQKVGAVSAEDYMFINSDATENLAKVAATINPDVRFIFFSTVSVYGEKNMTEPTSEDSDYCPSSDYAVSKLDAERRLLALSDEGIIHDLVILRLAPVYDRKWSLNLDRRVFAPGKLAYLRFGSGSQKMSALARPTLVDFIEFLINKFSQINADGDILPNQRNLQILNICDADLYEFKTIIRIFKKSGIHPNMPVFPVPLSVVWFATRIAGVVFPDKREWIYSCYDKLAVDLVYSNKKMLETGFKPVHNLESVFLMDG